MKIRLDESISNRIAMAIAAIAQDREGFEVSFVRHGDGSPDPDWIRKFAAEGGTAIVSGDFNILQHWPNLIAYTESGLISFFPSKHFSRLKAYGRAAFIIQWWPAIIEKIKVSKPGDRWRMPMNWTETDHMKMVAITDPRIDEPQQATDTTKAKQLSLEPIRRTKPG